MATKKIYARPPMKDLGQSLAWITLSSSNPTRQHITLALETPLMQKAGVYDFVCSCQGWRNHKKCWHVEEAEKEVILRAQGVCPNCGQDDCKCED